jgi:uncharacterized protein YcnI
MIATIDREISMTARFTAALFISLFAAASPAFAHVTLETKEAAVGGSYKAVFRVPHGCGASPTLKLRVRIPDGVIGVKPMPKPGWTLTTESGAYDKPHAMFHDSNVTQGVKEVDWSGKLLNENYDEFVLSVFLSDSLKPGDMLYFPVVQECESGAARWIEIPEAGKSAGDYQSPAPGLKLLPKRQGR